MLREDELNGILRLLAVHRDDLLVSRRPRPNVSGSEIWWLSQARGYEPVGEAETRSFEPRPRRWIADGLAVFVDEADSQRDLLGRRRNGDRVFQTQVLAASVRGDVLATLADDGAMWSVSLSSGAGSTVVQRFDAPMPPGRPRAPIVTDDRVFWQTGTAVWATPLSRLQPSRVAEDCELLAAGAAGAVVVGCGYLDGGGIRAYERLEWSMGGQVSSPVFGVQGVVTGAVLLDDARLVWVEYESDTVLCSGDRGIAGQVRTWVLGTRALPVDIADVRAPCLCCGAYWPPPQLDGAGAAAAWNYGDTDSPQRESPVGWARWETCDP